jgi:hypothetical protein
MDGRSRRETVFEDSTMIYLLLNDEVNGPHESGKVQELLDAGTIMADCPACIEGMKDWRAVGEALVWARGKLLAEVRPMVLRQVQNLKAGKTTVASARLAVKEALPAKLAARDPKVIDSIGILIQTNADLFRNHEQFWQQHDADVLDLWPALELSAICKSDFPRDWPKAWAAAGGKFFDGRMIARKDDPLWLALSDFGFPFAPFSFDRGYWTKEVGRDESTQLGIIGDKEIPQAVTVGKNFELVGIS